MTKLGLDREDDVSRPLALIASSPGMDCAGICPSFSPLLRRRRPRQFSGIFLFVHPFDCAVSRFVFYRRNVFAKPSSGSSALCVCVYRWFSRVCTIFFSLLDICLEQGALCSAAGTRRGRRDVEVKSRTVFPSVLGFVSQCRPHWPTGNDGITNRIA